MAMKSKKRMRPADQQDEAVAQHGYGTAPEVEEGPVAEPMSDAPLLLPDGRDARLLGLIDLWAAVSPIVPGLDQGDGKAALLAAYERHVWDGVVAKLTPAERVLVERR